MAWHVEDRPDRILVYNDTISKINYYFKSVTTVSGDNGNIIITSDGVIVVNDAYKEFILPVSTTELELIEIIDGYLGGTGASGTSDLSKDAFSRDRVSGTGQRADVEFLYDKQPDYFDEIINNGTVTHNGNTRDLTLSLSDANNGSYAEMRSHPIVYTPGNSQLIEETTVLDLANIGGGNAEFFLRSSISGSAADLDVVHEDDWAIDTTSMDWSKSHILGMDFQSLKVGTIRFFKVANGAPTYLGSIHNDNLRNSGYWQMANLPAYFKVYTTGGITYMECGYGNDANAIGYRYKIAANASATMKAICCTVKSEGGADLVDIPGLPRVADRGISTYTVSTTLVPLISIRPKSTFQTFDNMILSLPKSVFVQTDESIRYVILHDAVLTNAAWNDVDTSESCMEFDIAATAVSNGHEIDSEYVYASGGGGKGSIVAAGNTASVLGKTVLWDKQGSGTGILTVAAIRSDASDAAVLAGIRWEEIR